LKPPLFFPNLSERHYEEELMDSPKADPKKLYRTIKQFDVINRLFSAGVRLFRRHLLPQMLKDKSRVWTLLDFGSGGGDIDRALIRLSRRLGLKLRITALDVDPRVLPWARQLCRKYPEITPVHGSVFDLPEGESWDFVMSNHTLHHFDWDNVIAAVFEALERARVGILLNDLARSSWGYLGYTIFTGLFLHRSLAFHDGRLSIRRGFTLREFQEILGPLSDRLVFGTAHPSRVWVATRPMLP
jgi:SAM-dependent methyltransferase